MYAPSLRLSPRLIGGRGAAAARRQPGREVARRRAQPAADAEAAAGRAERAHRHRRIAALKGMTVADGGLRIGAMTTHAEVAASPLVAHALPGRWPRPRPGSATWPVSNRGTIGGSVAHADPAADLPTVLIARRRADRDRRRRREGTRTIEAADFFEGMMATALGEGEILTAIGCPDAAAGTGAAYAKFAHPASRYAVVGAAAVVDRGRRRLQPRHHHRRRRHRHAGCGCGSVEAALTGARLTTEVIAAASAKAAGDLAGDLMGDLFASAEYRRHVAGAWVAKAVTAAADAGAVSPTPLFASIDDVQARLAGAGYVADRGLATSIYLAVTLRRPLFLEGEAGVGKTSVAAALAAALGAELIRLQCYEGLDISHAVYEWDYARQLLELRILEAADTVDRESARRELFSDALPDQAAAAARARRRRRAPAGAAHRRDRSRRRGVRGLPARAALRIPDHDPRARHDRSDRAAGGRADLEPHARSARRAEAPLSLPVDRVPGLRQGTRHRAPEGAGGTR